MKEKILKHKPFRRRWIFSLGPFRVDLSAKRKERHLLNVFGSFTFFAAMVVGTKILSNREKHGFCGADERRMEIRK
jgi:hypothetical protein